MAEPTILGREETFRRLLSAIEGPVSRRWALVKTTAFLEELSGLGREAEAYLLPLASPLAELAGQLDPVGLRPEQVLRPARLIGQLRGSLEVGKAGLLAGAEKNLRRRAALLFAYAGAPVRAARAAVPETELCVQDLPAASPSKRLEAALRRVTDEPGAPAAAEESLRWIQARWGRGAEGSEARLPVVERLPGWFRQNGRSGKPTGTPSVGALRRLRLEVFSAPPAEKDQLKAPGRFGDGALEGPARAARRLLEDRREHLSGRYLKGHLTLKGPPALGGDREARLQHEGGSLGLAAASLFFCTALEEAGERHRLAPRPGAAFTGKVEGNRAVRPVEEESLPTKVRAAFFSPTATLAVPESQTEEAKAALQDLKEAYPHGQLDIIGVSRLRDVFDHRRLTQAVETPWAIYAARQAWSRKGGILASTVILALALALAWVVYGPIDKNPVAIGFAGEEMLLKNESGQVLERISVGEEVVQAAKTNNYQAYRLGDIDENGQNEICWARRTSGRRESPPQLLCKGVGEDTLRWRLETTFDVPFPRKPAVTTKGFGADHIRIGDFDASGRPEMIVTLRHNKYFPYLVLKLDAETGRELGRYVHAGYFFSRPLIDDLNGDGVQEIMLAGMNNAFDQAVFTVLDPRYVEGHGPTRGDYVSRDTDPAREIAYVRIPATVVDRAQPETVNKGQKLVNYSEKSRVLAEVWDGRHPGSGRRASRVLIQMNYRFRPVAIGTSSQYDRLADRLAENGEIEEVPDYEYFQQYKEGFRYWTGSGWSREPTINARWRAASGTDWDSTLAAPTSTDSSSLR